jgi:hypothetical protein
VSGNFHQELVNPARSGSYSELTKVPYGFRSKLLYFCALGVSFWNETLFTPTQDCYALLGEDAWRKARP